MSHKNKTWSYVRQWLQRLTDPLNMHALDLTDLGLDGLAVQGDAPIEQAASLLDRAHRIFVFMGSGLSRDSGIATFRGEQNSLYRDDAIKYTQARTFLKNAQEQIQWHAQWFEHIQRAKPNAGHHALARIIGRGGDHTLVTQNVDLLLEDAMSQHHLHTPVVHLHGRLDKTRGHKEDCPQRHIPWTQQRCQACHEQLRPDVVWFGEQLDQNITRQLIRSALSCDVCLLIGTSGLVYPAAMIPELAREANARLIEINPNETLLSEYCDVRITTTASYALSMIEARMQRR